MIYRDKINPWCALYLPGILLNKPRPPALYLSE